MMPVVVRSEGQMIPSRCDSIVAKGRIETAGSFRRQRRLATVFKILVIKSRMMDMSGLGRADDTAAVGWLKVLNYLIFCEID